MGGGLELYPRLSYPFGFDDREDLMHQAWWPRNRLHSCLVWRDIRVRSGCESISRSSTNRLRWCVWCMLVNAYDIKKK